MPVPGLGLEAGEPDLVDGLAYGSPQLRAGLAPDVRYLGLRGQRQAAPCGGLSKTMKRGPCENARAGEYTNGSGAGKVPWRLLRAKRGKSPQRGTPSSGRA